MKLIKRIYQQLNFGCLIMLMAAPALVNAQVEGEPLNYGIKVTIRSEILDENRDLLISTPRMYAISNQPLPVLFLLDGEDHFYHVSSLVRFLAGSEIIPNLLVVAVVNTNRDRDYLTPTVTARDDEIAPNAGGADKFLSFLQSELIPWVDKHYRTTNHRTLFGHSAGGYFTLYAMLESPETFSAYIAASPALGWGDENLLTLAKQKPSKNNLDAETLFMSMGDEGPGGDRQINRLASAFNQYGPKRVQPTVQLMPTENHLTTPHQTMYQGLESIFAGWYVKDPLALYDQKGIDGLHQHFDSLDKKFGLDRGTPQNVLRLLGGNFFTENRLDELAALVLYDPYRYPYPPDGIAEIARRYEARDDKDNAIKFYSQALKSNAAYEPAREKLTALGVDVDEVVDQVAPEEDLLDQIAGKYRMPNGSVWEIQVKNSGLFALFNGNEQPLIMRSPTEYAFGFGAVMFEFIPKGKTADLKVRYQATRWEEAVRID